MYTFHFALNHWQVNCMKSHHSIITQNVTITHNIIEQFILYMWSWPWDREIHTKLIQTNILHSIQGLHWKVGWSTQEVTFMLYIGCRCKHNNSHTYISQLPVIAKVHSIIIVCIANIVLYVIAENPRVAKINISYLNMKIYQMRYLM